ncbi:hypothetical protein LguiB_005993 [Lonicera macranthoides]
MSGHKHAPLVDASLKVQSSAAMKLSLPMIAKLRTLRRYVNLNTGPSNSKHFEIKRIEEWFVRKEHKCVIAVYCSA